MVNRIKERTLPQNCKTLKEGWYLTVFEVENTIYTCQECFNATLISLVMCSVYNFCAPRKLDEKQNNQKFKVKAHF